MQRHAEMRFQSRYNLHTWHRTGFNKAIRELIKREEEDDDRTAEMLVEFKANMVVPDLYSIEEETRQVVAVEIENTHPIPQRKWFKFMDIFWLLDELGWQLSVVTADKHGTFIREYCGLAICAYAEAWPNWQEWVLEPPTQEELDAVTPEQQRDAMRKLENLFKRTREVDNDSSETLSDV